MFSNKHIRNDLGESPVWHPQRQRYYWVDITKKQVHSMGRDDQPIETINLPDCVGCIVVADNGNLIAALAREIVEICLHTHEIRHFYTPKLPSDVMFNDGKVDCMGRFWVGTKDIAEQNPTAALYCLDHRGFSRKACHVTISNGTDWNLDNTIMYYTDSPTRKIYQYDFDAESGTIRNRRVFADIENGYPDGLTVDNQGRIWSAQWDGSCVTCFTPDGKVDTVVPLAAKRPTSCCFGGVDYQELFITSASIGLTLNEDDQDGFIFQTSSLATGKPCYLFKCKS